MKLMELTKLSLTVEQFVDHLQENVSKIRSIRPFKFEGKLVRILVTYKNKKDSENIELID